jgi:hypothetical protein
VAEWTLDFNARWLLVVKSHLEIHLLPPLLRISARGEQPLLHDPRLGLAHRHRHDVARDLSGLTASVDAVANDILPRDWRITAKVRLGQKVCQLANGPDAFEDDEGCCGDHAELQHGCPELDAW